MRAASFATLGLLLAMSLAACGGGASPPPGPPDPPGLPGPPDPPGLPGDTPFFRDGFESGLGLWTKDTHLPPSPDDPTVPVDWAIEAAASPVVEGTASVRLFLDGRQDDGTVWLERALSVAPDTAWRVTVAGAWWSENESFNTTAVTALYAGAVSPEVELDFDVSGILNEVAGWKTYVRAFDVTSGADGRIHVGVGVSVVWETYITYYLDDVRVWIEPR